jgi:hypothetical protein
MKGICEHLQQAADPTSWPSGITYSPNHDGVPLKSLGVYEHWNNATDMQYSRNLGIGDGIELVKVGPVEDLIAAPVQLSVKAYSSTEIKLTWKDNSAKEEGYIIESSKGDSLHYSQAGVVNKDSTNFVFKCTESNAKFFFRVKAYKGSYFSNSSNEVSAFSFPTNIDQSKSELSNSLKVIPCQNSLRVIVNNNYKGPVSLSVYDLSGRKITSVEFIKTLQMKEELVNMNGEKGFFIVTLKCDGELVSKKIVL